MTYRVLVVEDDDLIGASLERALAVAGYTTARAGSLQEAAAAAEAEPPDLVLLDRGLPDGDGIDLIATVHATNERLPVIVLTARDEEIDVVLGLQAGAVDYVTKPFRLAELLARIATQLRAATVRDERATNEKLVVDDIEIDLDARRVWLAGEEIELRPKEFDLLVRLARDAGKVVTREDLMSDVWDEHWWGSTKTLDVHITALRRKLGEESGQPSRISVVRGVGYRLERSE